MRITVQIRQIYKAICFIEKNLKEEITVAQIAKEAEYSLFHFCRQFSKITGFSPFHYLIKRRIHQSVLDLLNTKHNISRIAFEYCFNSPETYSRAFRRVLGMLPGKFRNTHSKIPDNTLMPPLTKDDLKFRNSPDFKLPEIIDIEEFRIYGIMGRLQDRDILIAQLATSSEIIEYYQLSKLPKEWFVFAGSKHPINPHFAIKDVLPAKCIRATCRLEEKQQLETFLKHTWIPAENLTIDESYYLFITKIDSSILIVNFPLIR